jgi:hypothetical protein
MYEDVLDNVCPSVYYLARTAKFGVTGSCYIHVSRLFIYRYRSRLAIMLVMLNMTKKFPQNMKI